MAKINNAQLLSLADIADENFDDSVVLDVVLGKDRKQRDPDKVHKRASGKKWTQYRGGQDKNVFIPLNMNSLRNTVINH